MESAGIYRQRLRNNRGNTYLSGTDLNKGRTVFFGKFPDWDCKNLGFESQRKEGNPAERYPACHIDSPSGFKGETRKFPHVEREDYTKGRRGTPGTAP